MMIDQKKLKELRREIEYAQETGATPDISAWDLFEVLNIAERAVSPAESVQSIDTPELAEILGHIVDEAVEEAQPYPKYAAEVIAHIEALCVKDHNRGYKAGHRDTWKDAEAALAKEKERADRAEAANKDLNANQDAWMRRTHEAEDRANDQLAARDCMRWALEQIAVGDAKFPRQRATDALVEAGLWSATAVAAQPLQQEGGKIEEAAKAIYGLLPEDSQGSPADYPWREGGNSDMQDLARRMARAAFAAPQQSDNLQQASTAQVEPAKEDTFETGYKNLVFVLRCIASGHHNSEELARNVLKHGLLPDTAATAEQVADKEADSTTWQANAGLPPGEPLKRFVDSLPLPQYPATPAQATPEGADLPPLPEGKTFTTAGPCEISSMFTPEDMREYARNHEAHLMQSYAPLMDAVSAKYRIEKAEAALAATTAAEPVYQVQSIKYPGTWEDASVTHWKLSRDEGRQTRTLYRAVSPQQVAPMTPEMLRAVQLRSEVGTYITANWANAYDCLQELWRVACEAQGKQVDTGGLPG